MTEKQRVVPQKGQKAFYNIVVLVIRPSDKIIGRHVKKVGKARKVVKRRLCCAVFVTNI